MGDAVVGAASAPVTTRTALRASRAIAFFGTWMIFGLFLDGWAHSANKPETFFSPWHGILYSGFVAALAWFAWDGRRSRTRARSELTVDRLATAGLVLFVVGAVSDGVWHQLFGIEVDIEALLSPSHLALMTGGAMMVSAPVRVAWDVLPSRPSMREFLSAIASVTLVASLLLFFLMYLSAARPIAGIGWTDEDGQGWGVASVLVRTAVTMGATLLVLRRWQPPPGSFTILFSVTSIALAGLNGFQWFALALPFVAGGMLADIIVALRLGGRGHRLLAVVVPAVVWLLYFGVHAVAWGVHWPAEIWTGAVVFAALTGLGLALLASGLGRQVEMANP